MASGICTYLKNALAGHIHGAAWSQPATLYVGLCTGVADNGTISGEPSGGNYARVSVDNNDTTNVWSAASGGVVNNSHAAITFPQANGNWGTMTKYFVSDHSSGNTNTLYWVDLDEPVTISSGDTPRFSIGAFVFSFGGTASSGGTTEPGAVEPAWASYYTLYDNFTTDTPSWANATQWIKRVQSVNVTGMRADYKTANVYYSNGRLVLHCDIDTWDGAQVMSQTSYTLGTYYAGLKIVLTQGAFVTMSGDMNDGTENEIKMTFFYDGAYKVTCNTKLNGTSTSSTITLGFNPGDGYHNYGWNWSASNKVEFYANDVVIYTSTTNIPDLNLQLYFQAYASDSPPGSHGDGVNDLYVEYIDVYCPASETTAFALNEQFDSLSSWWWIRANTWDSTFAYTIFKTANVWVDAGNVVMRADCNTHYGAEIRTGAKYSYGRYRCRAKCTQTEGCWHAPIWSYLWPVQGVQRHGEIDIELMREGGVSKVMYTSWVDGTKSEDGGDSCSGEIAISSYGANAWDISTYHIYEYRWRANSVEFYVDDILRFTATGHIPTWPLYGEAQIWLVKNMNGMNLGTGINTMYIDWMTIEEYQ